MASKRRRFVIFEIGRMTRGFGIRRLVRWPKWPSKSFLYHFRSRKERFQIDCARHGRMR